MHPEKNDIDISKLFTWGDKFEIYDKKGDTKLEYYCRLVGDSELNRARVFALRKSAEMRKKLKDRTSEDRKAFVADIDSFSKEDLVNIILMMTIREITIKSIDDVQVPMPKELSSDANLEEQEDYQLEVDKWSQLKEEKVREYVNSEVDKLKAKYENMTKEQLYSKYEETTIDTTCEGEMLLSYHAACTFYGCFKDPEFKERLFSSQEQLDNLPTDIKRQFLDNYTSLEVDMEGLKK